MYIGQKPQRRSNRLVPILLVLIAIAAGFLYYVRTSQPQLMERFEPTPTPTRTPQSLAIEAEAHYGQGQLDEAIAAYEQVVTISPNDATAHVRLAQLLILRARTAEAAEQAVEAVLLEPSNPEGLASLCRALDWEGQYAEAFDACGCAIELAPDYAEAYAYLAEVYADTGDWIPARNYAQQAVDLNYQSMDAHRNQGYVLEKQGRYRQAVEAYENAIVLHPRLASLYLAVGRNYRALGKFTEAVDRFEKAIRLDPGDPAGYDQLGWTYYTAGQYSRAIDTLEQATLIDPNYTVSWGHLGIVYYVLQQYEEAIPALQQAISPAEEDYLHRARDVLIVGQDTTLDLPRPIELMRGDFHPGGEDDVEKWHATMAPVLTRGRVVPKADQTCGDLIAYELSRQSTFDASASEEEIDPDDMAAAFLNASGEATIDLKTHGLELQLSGIPRPEEIPYEVQLLMWPGTTLGLGYFQPDSEGNGTFSYEFKDRGTAPVEYYYSLGFAYVYLGQCDKGVPWLLDSLDIDSSPSNPAWQGLADCPENPPADTVEEDGE